MNTIEVPLGPLSPLSLCLFELCTMGHCVYLNFAQYKQYPELCTVNLTC